MVKTVNCNKCSWKKAVSFLCWITSVMIKNEWRTSFLSLSEVPWSPPQSFSWLIPQAFYSRHPGGVVISNKLASVMVFLIVTAQLKFNRDQNRSLTVGNLNCNNLPLPKLICCHNNVIVLLRMRNITRIMGTSWENRSKIDVWFSVLSIEGELQKLQSHWCKNRSRDNWKALDADIHYH